MESRQSDIEVFGGLLGGAVVGVAIGLAFGFVFAPLGFLAGAITTALIVK